MICKRGTSPQPRKIDLFRFVFQYSDARIPHFFTSNDLRQLAREAHIINRLGDKPVKTLRFGFRNPNGRVGCRHRDDGKRTVFRNCANIVKDVVTAHPLRETQIKHDYIDVPERFQTSNRILTPTLELDPSPLPDQYHLKDDTVLRVVLHDEDEFVLSQHDDPTVYSY